ncbi:hypothetical protein AB0B45_46330 [Nonomuraea sp. NPDC049152]|uniref:hypothetical protein n=1 Tax=Nonomuraea sp. NPDC049152 TaxID=3154350 RepID=UPI0033E582BE
MSLIALINAGSRLGVITRLPAGFGTNDGGVVIDLSRPANVEIIDKERAAATPGVRSRPSWPGVADLLGRHQERRCRWAAVRVRGTPDDRRLLRQERLPCIGGGRRAPGVGGLPPHRPRGAHIHLFVGGSEAPVEIQVDFDGVDPELAAQAIDPIRRLGTVIDDDVALIYA